MIPPPLAGGRGGSRERANNSTAWGQGAMFVLESRLLDTRLARGLWRASTRASHQYSSSNLAKIESGPARTPASSSSFLIVSGGSTTATSLVLVEDERQVQHSHRF